LGGHGDHGWDPRANLYNARAQLDVLRFTGQIGQRNDSIHAPSFSGPNVINAHLICVNSVVDQVLPIIAVVVGAPDSDCNFHKASLVSLKKEYSK
jgi:hypothetical protein